MSMRTRSLCVALLCAMVALGAFAQSVNLTTGSIAGKVTDNSGAPLPGVTVTTASLDTGLTRNTYTDKDGLYDFNLLPPGNYKVVAELAGLGSARIGRTTVLLGTTTSANLKLAPQVSETITVTASTPIVDVQRSGTASSITNEQLQNLPLLGRDFRSLASLTPGITADAFTGASPTANGARPLSTDFNVDGASSNNDFYGQQTGGTRAPFTFSQAAIKEFQVITTVYDAEYGRGVGAIINAITKSGTNDIEGEAFYFKRSKAWASTRPTVFNTDIGGTTYPLPISDSFTGRDSTQPGFALGGPIVRDKFFYFVNTDGQRQSLPNLIGNDMRTSSQFLALTPAQQQTVLSKIQSSVGAPYERGLAYDQTFNLNTYLVKLDANLGSKNHWSLRDNITKFNTANSGSTSTFGLNQTNEVDKFYQAVLEGDTVITNNLFNQFVGQIAHDQRPVTTQFGGTEFNISWPTTQYFGFNDTTPSTADEKKYQIKDTVQYMWNGHSIKAGAELLHRHLFDAFPRYAAGLYSFSNLTNFVNNTPNTFRQAYGPNNGDVAWDTNLWGTYVNDSFHVGTRWTINLGLRYDYMKTPRPPSNAFPQHPEFLSQIRDDKNNLGPRFGFAYDVRGDGRSVVRGGVGKFFSYMPDILMASPIQGISGALITTNFTCTTTASNPCPVFPALLTPTQFLALSKLSADLVTIGSNYQAQEALRSTLQYEQRLGDLYSVAVSATNSKLTHVQGTKNINLVPTGIVLGNMPVYDYNSSANPARPYADMGNIREITSNEQAWYRSQGIEFHKFAGNSKLSWDLNYTHASSYDEETNTRSTSTTFLIDPNNPRLSEAYSDNDIRHRAVGDITYRLPWGFQVSGIWTYHSGYPYTAAINFSCSGCVASSLTGQAQTTAAASSTPVFVNSSGQIIDLTQGTGMTKAQFAAFLSGQGARMIGRNTMRQSGVSRGDLRLSKSFNLTHGMQLQLIGEVFNVLDKQVKVVTSSNMNLFRITYTQSTDKYTITKYTNTVSGTALNTFGLVQGYSSEVDPRQLQFAAKFIF